MKPSYIIWFFRSGSRYELPENIGVSSVLRSSAGLTTEEFTKFGIIRNLQQIGTSLSVTSDRESIAYTLEGTPDKMYDNIVVKYTFI